MEKANLSSSHFYGMSDPSFTQLIKAWEENANTRIRKEFSYKVELIQTILNLDYAIACYYMPIVLNPAIEGLRHRSPVLFSAYHRNWYAFFASYDLTCNGLFGPARSILRHAFESMIIAKFCSLSKSDALYEKWIGGDAIYFTNNILKRISKPDPKIFSELWSTLSEFTHATIYAQQMSLDWDHINNNVQFNLDLILILLEWHYHILTSHVVTSSTRYYTTYISELSGSDGVDNLRQLKQQLRLSFKNAKQDMPRLTKQVVRDFKQTWVLCE